MNASTSTSTHVNIVPGTVVSKMRRFRNFEWTIGSDRIGSDMDGQSDRIGHGWAIGSDRTWMGNRIGSDMDGQSDRIGHGWAIGSDRTWMGNRIGSDMDGQSDRIGHGWAIGSDRTWMGNRIGSDIEVLRWRLYRLEQRLSIRSPL